MHAAMHPNARGTIVNIPPIAEPRGAVANALPSTPQVNEDLLGIFDSMTVSKPAAAASNPFDLVSKPDPPEMVVPIAQPHASQQVPVPAPAAIPVIEGSAQAPIQVDLPFQPTVVPLPAQPLPAVNQTGYGYAQPSSQSAVPPGQGQQYPGYTGHPSQGQVPPQYQVQPGYAHTMQHPPQQQAPPKSSNPFDPFA